MLQTWMAKSANISNSGMVTADSEGNWLPQFKLGCCDYTVLDARIIILGWFAFMMWLSARPKTRKGKREGIG